MHWMHITSKFKLEPIIYKELSGRNMYIESSREIHLKHRPSGIPGSEDFSLVSVTCGCAQRGRSAG